jgi:hypothetical protein
MTVLIQGGRRSGRTSRLVERVMEDPYAILVVHSEDERRRIIREYHLPPFQIVGPHHSTRGRQGRLYVDNADLVMAALLGQVPHACVFEGDELSGCAKRGCCEVLTPWNSFGTKNGKVWCLHGHIPRLARLRVWWQERTREW